MYRYVRFVRSSEIAFSRLSLEGCIRKQCSMSILSRRSRFCDVSINIERPNTIGTHVARRMATSSEQGRDANSVWWYKEDEIDGNTNNSNDTKKKIRANGPYTSKQLFVWMKAGVLGNVSVSSAASGQFVRASEVSRFAPLFDGTIATATFEKPSKETKLQKVKRMFRDYGSVFVVFYGTCWLVPFIPLYGALELGIVDCVELMETVGIDQVIDPASLNLGLLNFIAAVECNELLDIARLPLVVAATPRVARWWRGRKTN